MGRSRDHGRLLDVEALAGGAGDTWHIFDQGGDWGEIAWPTNKTKTMTKKRTCWHIFDQGVGDPTTMTENWGDLVHWVVSLE